MRRISFVIQLICFFASSLVCHLALGQSEVSHSSRGIQFDDKSNWAQIKQRAKAEKKYIFLDCNATWCAPCKVMEEEVYTLPEVGDVVNKQFISVMVQFDKTAKDNDRVKSWYADANALSAEFAVTKLPTYLFFTPDGELIHRGFGYLAGPAFINLVNFATDPKRKEYYTLLRDYKNGKKDYAALPDMIKSAREVFDDQQLARQLAKDYKYNYLDKLPADKAITRKNIDFLIGYTDFLHSKDVFFKTAIRNPAAVETLQPGFADGIIAVVLSREELNNKLMSKDSTYKQRTPDWAKLLATIKKKYPGVEAEALIRGFKVGYYADNFKDWKLWANAKDEELKFIKPDLNDIGAIYTTFNTYSSWHAFLRCNDVEVLNKAIGWIDVAINIIPDSNDGKPAYMDTKAAILYKLGRVDEAIALEEKVLKMQKGFPNVDQRSINEFELALSQMKKGDPTWVEDNADWDAESLKRIKR
jgi:thioredoxin-related protein